MVADHAVVPVAVPAPPVDVFHWMDATPTLSLALPLIAIVVAAVDVIDEPGVTIVSTGAMVSAAPALGAGGAAGAVELTPPGALPVEEALPVALPPLVAGGAALDGGPYRA